jgi:6-pyruvoyltetrahydropterin/6-carboxytetrahydropterin synthase
MSALNRTYCFKFYLNANHYIIIDGVEGETHPHTWEFTIDIMMQSEDFVPFNVYEKAIDFYFEKFQNKVMNDFEPFNVMVPTLENMSEVFVADIRDIVEEHNGRLLKMESSETPTRSYILSFEENEDIKRSRKKYREAHREKVVEEAVANIL